MLASLPACLPDLKFVTAVPWRGCVRQLTWQATPARHIAAKHGIRHCSPNTKPRINACIQA